MALRRLPASPSAEIIRFTSPSTKLTLPSTACKSAPTLVPPQLLLLFGKVDLFQVPLSYCKADRYFSFFGVCLFVFLLLLFFMEGHSFGSCDNKQAGGRSRVILRCAYWNSDNLKVRKGFLRLTPRANIMVNFFAL